MSIETNMYKVGDEIKLTTSFVRTSRQITFEKGALATIDVILTDDPEGEYVISCYIPKDKRRRSCKVWGNEIAPLELDDGKETPDEKAIPDSWKPTVEQAKEIVEKTAEMEESAPDSTENGPKGDHTKAKGVLADVLPDQPAEDLIRQSRDGDPDGDPDSVPMDYHLRRIDQVTDKAREQREKLETHVKKLESQIDDLLAQIKEAPNLHRKALIEALPAPTIEHLLLHNTHSQQLNDYVSKGWQIVSVQFVMTNNPTKKIPLPCACAHLTRPVAKAKSTGDDESDKPVVLSPNVTPRIVQDLIGMEPDEIITLTEGMPASYRSQVMNAHLKQRALAHVRR